MPSREAVRQCDHGCAERADDEGTLHVHERRNGSAKNLVSDGAEDDRKDAGPEIKGECGGDERRQDDNRGHRAQQRYQLTCGEPERHTCGHHEVLHARSDAPRRLCEHEVSRPS